MTDTKPRPGRADVEHQVREYFPMQVEACEDLLAFAVDVMEAHPWRGRPIRDSQLADTVIAAEAARGLKTFRGSLDAALGGFGPQAAMLNRALFEAMATTCWACANPELASERFSQHQRHHRALWSKRYLASGMIDRPLPGIPDPEEQRKLDRLFGPWGDKLWCGLPLHELVAAIEDQWDEGARLKGFFVIAHATNNEVQHTTTRSLLQPVMRNTEDHLQVDSGPSLQGVEPALHGAMWTYAHLLRAVGDYFEIEGRGELKSVFARCEATFMPIDPEAAKGTERNDPCPCGSGKKYKRCHGR